MIYLSICLGLIYHPNGLMSFMSFKNICKEIIFDVL